MPVFSFLDTRAAEVTALIPLELKLKLLCDMHAESPFENFRCPQNNN